MYYDNKSTFYIKEYGPKVAIILVSIVLILSGAFVYYNTTIKPNKQPIIAENNIEKDKNPLVNVEKEEMNKVKDNTYFINLPLLTKSDEVIVTSVTDDIIISVENDTSVFSFKLIGIDTSYNTQNIKDEIQNNLIGKKVKIAFDKVRNENNNYKAYVFLDNELYNAEILKKGVTILLGERNNFALNNKLSEGQKYARTNSLGVWHK